MKGLLRNTNKRTSKFLKIKGHVVQNKIKVLRAFKMKGHIEQSSKRLIMLLHIKVHFKAIQMKGLWSD